MRILATAFSALVLGATALSSSAVAGDGAAAITERQALMKLQGVAAGTIKAAVDSKDPARLKAAEGAARALSFSARAIPTMFPKGSDDKAGKTAALPKIWEDPDGFKKTAETLSARAAALADALKEGDPAKAAAAFDAAGKDGCGACHGTYRAKQ